ncbi:MAG: aminotransferase class V-fold PLP-dependent enzyme [bacterium]|nr:aminotransferase class V-fold PLP-dependent enzyme [Candidatus Kapabacteria bacterium]
MQFQTRAVHAGREPDATTGAVVQPISLSTTFQIEQPGDSDSADRFSYARRANPNRNALETALAELDGGAAAAAFGSGSAATMAVFQSLSPGDHVILPSARYHGTLSLLRDLFGRWGLEYTAVEMDDPNEVERAMTPRTRLVWIETPSNPKLIIVDIARTAAIAHAHNAVCCVDNTFGTPALQRPFEHGADLIVYSTTKYISGHSDVLGGAVTTRVDDERWPIIRSVQHLGGAVPSPFECWLTLRSLSTLPLRMRAHCDGALAVATFLDAHPKVSVVHYPGLASHPGHDIARRQMSGFSGMLSFQHADGESAAMSTVTRARLLRRATSLGGVESLIEHRASTEGPTSQTPRDLIRLSIGIEHPVDLIADLEQALRP